MSRVLDTFVKNYNNTNPTCRLEQSYLASKNGTLVPFETSVGQITGQLGAEFLVRRGSQTSAHMPRDEWHEGMELPDEDPENGMCT
jgi:hypothetical protein